VLSLSHFQFKCSRIQGASKGAESLILLAQHLTIGDGWGEQLPVMIKEVLQYFQQHIIESFGLEDTALQIQNGWAGLEHPASLKIEKPSQR
jgi:hypothetical protein